MIFTRRFFILLILGVIPPLLTWPWPGSKWLLIGWNIALLVTAWLDYRRAEDIAQIEATRHLPQRFIIGAENEVQLELAMRPPRPITFHLKDLYDEGSASDRNPQISRNYFHFGADSPHRIEAGIEWQVSRKVPITLSWYTILFGARDVDTRGRRCYSSYVEVAYPFTVKTIDLKTGVGAAPWKTAGEGGAKGFAVKNVFINAGKLWAVKSMGSFRIGLFTHLSWCPLKEDMNCVGGISLRM